MQNLHATGTCLQESLRVNPAIDEVQNGFFMLLEGIIQASGVSFPGDGQNSSNQTLASITLLNGHPDIHRVPILASKGNKRNGESSDPEPGDRVLVGFITGNFCRPVVMGFLNMPGNNLQGAATDAPQYHHHWQGTDTKIGKDGTRTVHVAKDEVVEIIGDGTVTLGVALTINVTGDVKIKSTGGMITLDAVMTRCTGDFSAAGTVEDAVRTMSADRALYDAHVHLSAAPGNPTSPPGTPE